MQLDLAFLLKFGAILANEKLNILIHLTHNLHDIHCRLLNMHHIILQFPQHNYACQFFVHNHHVLFWQLLLHPE